MHPHRQISVYADAKIADGLHWSDVDAVNQHSSGWKLMLALACRAKDAHHRTSVLSGLSCSLFDFIQVAMASTYSLTCGESALTAVGGRGVYLGVVGVKMRRLTMAFSQRYELHGVQDEQNWFQHRILRHTADEVNDG